MRRFALLVLAAGGLACSGVGGGGGEKLDAEHTWTCGGSDKKTIQGQTIDMKGKDLIAVEAGGNCELQIVDCNITADFPIKAAGNAKVTITGGTITGRQQAIQSWGNAVVTVAPGAKIVGETATTGHGQIIGAP